MGKRRYCDCCGFHHANRKRCYPCGGDVCGDCSTIALDSTYSHRRVRVCLTCLDWDVAGRFKDYIHPRTGESGPAR